MMPAESEHRVALEPEASFGRTKTDAGDASTRPCSRHRVSFPDGDAKLVELKICSAV